MSVTINGTTGLAGVDGSASTPALQGTDSNTGITFGTDTVNVVTGGTTRATVDSSGNVGIGTSSPSGRLHVESSSGGLPLYVNTTASAQNARIRLNSTDNASSVSYVLSYSHASLNKQAAMLLGGTGSIGFYVNQTAGAEPTTGTLAATFDSSGNLLFNSGYGSVATAYGCRAWVNFNGTGTVAIKASGNVSSITDLNTGYYAVNFSTALVDTNYSVAGFSVCYSSANLTGASQVAFTGPNNGTYTPSSKATTTFRLSVGNPSTGAAVDSADISVSVFR